MRNNEGHVPEAFFKVLLCLNGTPKGIDFVAKNTTGTKKHAFTSIRLADAGGNCHRRTAVDVS